MKIIDYSTQEIYIKPLSNQSRLLEVATATLLFLVPVLTLFLLAK